MSSLALDVGGTFIKAAMIDRGQVLNPVVRTPIPAFLESDAAEGARELSADELDSAIFSALAELGVDLDAAPEVFISGQMAGLALVDNAGAAVGNIITWQDTRYTDVDGVARAMGAAALADLGDGLRVGSPAVTLAQRGVPRGAYPTSLIAYVAGRVAGLRARRIHATDAGSWGLLNTRSMQWSGMACTVVGLDVQILPEVVVSVEPIADASHVFTAIGDQQAALLGSGLNDQQVSVNLATGCQVSVLANDFSTGVQTRPYLDDHLLHTVTHLPAGRLLTTAVTDTYGDSFEQAWAQAAQECETQERIRLAVNTIADGVAEAVRRLDAEDREVLFSGGLIQQFTPLQEAILERLGKPDFRIFSGDDAALAGLAAVATKGL